MKRHITESYAGFVAMFLLATMVMNAGAGAFGKSYEQLLKKQGFKPLIAPRSNFGVGSVIPIDRKKNIFIAGQNECFPGLENEIQAGETKLIDSKDVRSLNISASGNYSPGGAAFIGKLAAAFGYTSTGTMDVSFGETTALSLTAVSLQTYLQGHKVNSVCVDQLTNPKNAVIFSMAKVNSLTYTFNGSKDVNGSLNTTALQAAITAAGSLDYKHTTDNSVTITTPLYVGYNAFRLKNLSISAAESSTSEPKVERVTVVKSDAVFPQ